MSSSATRSTALAALACVTTCMAVASVYASQAVLGEIAQRFTIPIAGARLAFSVSSVAYALAFFVLGPLSDLFSARRFGGLGLLTAAAATLAAAVVPAYPAFLAASALQGAAAAAVPVAMFALMPRIAGPGQVGTYFGLVIAASVVGITLGRAGMGLLSAGVGLVVAQQCVAGLLLALAALAACLPRETLAPAAAARSGAHLQALRMLAAPELLRLFGTGFLLFFGYLGVVTFLTLRLHEPPFAADAATIGAISLLGLGAVLGAPLSGRLVARVGSLPVALAGQALALAAIGWLGFASTLQGVGLGLFLIFLGVFVCQPAVFVRIAERVPAQRRGAASSLYLLTCLGAGSLASAALGPVWNGAGWAGVTAAGLLAVALSAGLLLSDARRGARPAAAAAAPVPSAPGLAPD